MDDTVELVIASLSLPDGDPLRLVAQWADTWHGFGAPEVIAHKCRVLDEHCAAIGRDPAKIERSVLVTSEDIAGGLLDRYYEAGARHFVAIAKEPDFDIADVRRLLAWRDSLMLG